MSERVVLKSRRRFPRARLSCDLVYGDRLQSNRSHTRDISLGGCRVAGYYPYPLGKSIALRLTHPSVPGPATTVGKVARLYGGADNAVGVLFDRHWRGNARFEEWLLNVISNDPNAQRTVAQTPEQIPIEARLKRAPKPQIQRVLAPQEIALMQRLDRSTVPVPLTDLRTEWGDQWEAKGQAVFGLLADGIILCLMLPLQAKPAADLPKFAVESFFKTSTQLMKDLETEYGPIVDKTFARQLETISQEVIGTEPDRDAARPNQALPEPKKRSAEEASRPPILLPYIPNGIKAG